MIKEIVDKAISQFEMHFGKRAYSILRIDYTNHALFMKELSEWANKEIDKLGGYLYFKVEVIHQTGFYLEILNHDVKKIYEQAKISGDTENKSATKIATANYYQVIDPPAESNMPLGTTSTITTYPPPSVGPESLEWQGRNRPAMEYETPKPIEKNILLKSNDLVYGDRQSSYGSVTTNFTNIAKLWSVILGKEITPHEVGLCMITVKVSRELNKQSDDNLIDIAGYAATLEKLKKGE